MLPPGAARAAEARGRPTVSDARSSEAGAWLLLVLLALATTWSALTLAMLLARGGTLGLLMDMLASDTGVLSTVMLVSGIGLLLTVVTALAWFWWFDRVLRNVPPLTGQWPDSAGAPRRRAGGWSPSSAWSRRRASWATSTTGWPWRAPPACGCWACGSSRWIGGTVAPWIAERVLGFLPLPLDLTLGLSDLISLLSQLSYIVAGVLAIALVLSIEHAQQMRMALGGAAAPRPTDGSEVDPRLQAALLAAARDNAAAKVAVHGRAPGSTEPFTAPPPIPPAATGGLGLSSHASTGGRHGPRRPVRRADPASRAPAAGRAPEPWGRRVAKHRLHGFGNRLADPRRRARGPVHRAPGQHPGWDVQTPVRTTGTAGARRRATPGDGHRDRARRSAASSAA